MAKVISKHMKKKSIWNTVKRMAKVHTIKSITQTD